MQNYLIALKVILIGKIYLIWGDTRFGIAFLNMKNTAEYVQISFERKGYKHSNVDYYNTSYFEL